MRDMKRPFPIITALLVVACAFGACDLDQMGSKATSTRIPGFVPTARPSNKASCNVLIPAAQQSAATPAQSTPIPSAIADLAPEYKEIRAKLDEVAAQFAEDLPEDKYETIQNEMEKYWSSLKGTQVTNWEGWAVRSGGEATFDLQYAAGHVINDPNALLVSLDDPYAMAQRSPLTGTRKLRAWHVLPPVAIISGGTKYLTEPLCVGQRVRFSGVITDAPTNYDSLQLYIPTAAISPVKSQLPQTVTAADLQDVEISLERTMCFGTCPAYKVMVYGNGMVLFQGHAFTDVLGFKISTVQEDAVRQLLAKFDEVDFFSLKDYTNEDVTDNPSAITSIITPAGSNSVNHYYGDHSAPQQLTTLEGKIDKVLNTSEWVGSDDH